MANTINYQPSEGSNQFALPYSKSISNRALILAQVSLLLNRFEPKLLNLSQADDTLILQEAFETDKETIHVKNAGTCLRFLLAFYSTVEGKTKTITGSERLKERPIHGLIQALQALGAQITYLEKEGKLPVKVIGRKLQGKTIEVPAHLSSQFISALLLISPLLEGPLHIQTKGKVVSAPYIQMTLDLLQAFGIIIEADENYQSIHCKPGPMAAITAYAIERDWSSAAFFYEALLLLGKGEMALSGLKSSGLQGDQQIAEFLKPLGIESEASAYDLKIRVKKTGIKKQLLNLDLSQHPDLAPPLICGLSGAEIPFMISGLESLKVKESDRVLALKEGLNQLGYGLTMPAEGTLTYDGSARIQTNETPVLNTFEDHRLVMAFSLMAIKLGAVTLTEINSVEKSFPHFFEELKGLGLKARAY